MKIIRNHLDFLARTSNETCQYLYKKELNPIQTFCLGLLERISNSALTLNILFKEMQTELKHEFSVGIITRALLLDTLITMNLYKIIKDAVENARTKDETEVLISEFCETILSDGLDKTFSYLKNAKDYGFIDERGLEKRYNNLATQYTKFIKPHPNDGSKPILKHSEFFAPTKLFKNLADTADLKNIAKLYDTYLYFSKYDHFGIMYYQIIREEHESKIKVYLESFETFLASQALLHTVLANYSNEDEFLKAQSEKTSEYFEENIKLES